MTFNSTTFADRRIHLKLVRRVIVLAWLSIALLHPASGADWHFIDRFTQRESGRLTQWIQHAENGLTSLFGPFPFIYEVYFYRQQSGSEPVPWAHTNKDYNRAVHFYVDTQYSQKQFERDWTATHELTHLLFPYVGRKDAWCSEGIATYLQYQAMYANYMLDWNTTIDRMTNSLSRAQSPPVYQGQSIENVSRLYPRIQNFPYLYWGGAVYFMRVDSALYQQKKVRLHTIIRKYMECCHQISRSSAQDMINTFDRISESTVFADTYQSPGFPDYFEALNWLKNNPPPLVNTQ